MDTTPLGIHIPDANPEDRAPQLRVMANDIDSRIGRGFSVMMTADVVRSNTTMTALADLTFNVTNGKKYVFSIVLHINDSAMEGIKIDLAGGSATVSAIRARYEFKTMEAAGFKHVNALNTVASIDSIDGGDGTVEIKGGLIASADGTIIPRVAQNSHSSGSLTVYRVSTIQRQEMA